MEFLPPYFIAGTVFLLGLIIGSFLDVIACRFHTGKSINGRSRCMSCGNTLTWYELFPLFSYLVLRGRCKNCNGRIPARLFFIEILTAFLFLYVALHTVSLLELAFGLVLSSVLLLIVLYDYNHMIIPNEFVYAVAFFAILFLGSKIHGLETMGVIIPFFLSASSAFLFYAGLWFFSKGKWIGFGDAKLAFVLGLFLTPVATFAMIVFSFWIGALISLSFLGMQYIVYSGKKHLSFGPQPLTMKSEIPFAPFMISSFIVVFFGHMEALSLIEHFL